MTIVGRISAMSTVETIVQHAQRLPEYRQQEVLAFIEFLLARESAQRENREWAAFSTQQITSAYGPADAIYDQE